MQCDMTILGRPCIAPGNDLHTCTACTLRFHHLCAGEDSGWDKCPECVSGSGAAPVQRAGPSSGAALAAAGDGRAAPAAAVPGEQRCVPAPTAVNTWQGFWAAKATAPPARPRAATKQVPAKAPGPAAARAAAAEGPEAVVSFLASVPVEQHATARERIVPINDGGARKRKSGASGGASGVDDEDNGMGGSGGPAKSQRQSKTPKRTANKGSAGDRMRAYTVDGLRLSEHHLGLNLANHDTLFCECCSEEVNTRTDVIDRHVRSNKHRSNAETQKRAAGRAAFIDKALATAHANGQVATGAHETGVSEDVVKARLALLEGALLAGIEVDKIDALRSTWEKATKIPLTGASHLRELIPIVHKAHVAEVREFVSGRLVALAVDAASRDGECFAVTARTVNAETFVPETCLIAVRMYAASFNGAQLAKEMSKITFEMGIAPGDIVVAIRDRARYGKVAMDVLLPIWDNALDMECFAHTLNHVGEQLKHPNLDPLLQALSYMWSASTKARFMWKQLTGRMPPTASETRWWSR